MGDCLRLPVGADPAPHNDDSAQPHGDECAGETDGEHGPVDANAADRVGAAGQAERKRREASTARSSPLNAPPIRPGPTARSPARRRSAVVRPIAARTWARRAGCEVPGDRLGDRQQPGEGDDGTGDEQTVAL